MYRAQIFHITQIIRLLFHKFVRKFVRNCVHKPSIMSRTSPSEQQDGKGIEVVYLLMVGFVQETCLAEGNTLIGVNETYILLVSQILSRSTTQVNLHYLRLIEILH